MSPVRTLWAGGGVIGLLLVLLSLNLVWMARNCDSLRPLVPGRRVSALEPGGELIAVLEARPGRRLRPVRVLRSLATPG